MGAWSREGSGGGELDRPEESLSIVPLLDRLHGAEVEAHELAHARRSVGPIVVEEFLRRFLASAARERALRVGVHAYHRRRQRRDDLGGGKRAAQDDLPRLVPDEHGNPHGGEHIRRCSLSTTRQTSSARGRQRRATTIEAAGWETIDELIHRMIKEGDMDRPRITV